MLFKRKSVTIIPWFLASSLHKKFPAEIPKVLIRFVPQRVIWCCARPSPAKISRFVNPKTFNVEVSSIFTFVARSSSDPWRDISGTDVQPVDDMPHLLHYPTLGFGTPLRWFTKNVVYMDHYVGAVCTNNGHQTVHRAGFSTWNFTLRRWHVTERSSYYKRKRRNFALVVKKIFILTM